MDEGRLDSSKDKAPQLDKIGVWSEIELQIIKEYAAAYSKILTKRQGII